MGKREREAARGKFSLALIVKDRIFVWGKASVCVFHVFELSWCLFAENFEVIVVIIKA